MLAFAVKTAKLKRFASFSIFTRDKHSDAKYAEVIDSELLPFDRVPGPASNKYFGTLLKYLPVIGEYSMEALHKNAQRNYQQYGKLVRERLLPSVSLLHVFDPDLMEQIFRQDARHPERRSHLALYHYRLNKPQVYKTGGLLPTNGDEWWRLRSTFQKSLTSPQVVRMHIERTDTIADEFIDAIPKQFKENEADDLLPFLNRLFLENICSITFDLRLASFSPSEQHPASRTSLLIRAASDSNSGVLKLDNSFLWKYVDTPLYARMCRAQEVLENFFQEILIEKLQFLTPPVSHTALPARPCLLDLFLRAPDIDSRDLTAMMVDILMAAVDTTSYTTSFLLYHLSRNPAKQQLLYKECLELLPTKDTPVTADVIAKAQYGKACIKESLRLNPVAVGVGRLLQNDLELSGYLIPKGTVIVTQNMVASRLHQYVTNPTDFIPERWLKHSPQYEALHPFLSLPFGFGVRSCIARRLAEQTICINLMKIIRNFELEWKGRDIDVKTLLINKPNGPIHLKFISRNK